MPIKDTARATETGTVNVVFAPGTDLDVTFRRNAFPYKKQKALNDISRDVQQKGRRAKQIAKQLEDKSLSEVDRERLEAEAEQINSTGFTQVEELLTALAGDNGKPGLLIQWDWFIDDEMTQRVPITTEDLSSRLGVLEIAKLFGAVSEAATKVGELKSDGSPAH
jgi:hypothetical protein